MIRGYPRYPSLRPGDTLTLHVSITSPRFRVAFFRQGASLEPVPGAGAGMFEGIDVPVGPPDQDCGRPAYDVPIPAGWRTGAYVAVLVEIDVDGTETAPDTTTTFGTSAKVTPPVKDADSWEWDEWACFNPEARVTGTALAAGGWWDGKRETLGYTVQHADHWAFAGTGLGEGDVFGDDEDFPLIGYEVDGIGFRRKGGHAIANSEVGSPPGFVILGIAELGPGWAAVRRDAVAIMGSTSARRAGLCSRLPRPTGRFWSRATHRSRRSRATWSTGSGTRASGSSDRYPIVAGGC